MKVIILLSACIVAVSASKTRYAAGPLVGAQSSGTSTQFRSEDNYGNYQFGYDESHATGSTSRREESTNGVRRGSYTLSDADGRHRVVNYIADADGFRATIQTNEPGVESKDSADVLVNKGAALAPVYAPAPAPTPLPAPVLAAPAPPPAPGPMYSAAPVKGYLARPAAPAGPSYTSPPAVLDAPEEETPRGFSYSFGATHLAPVAAPAPVGPIYQQRTFDY